MAGISISDLLRQRRQEAESVTQPEQTGQTTEERDRAGVTLTQMQEGREVLRQKLETTKQRMLEGVTKEQQDEWLRMVGTTINFYEQREFTDEELEVYYQIVLTQPEALKSEGAPHNLRLTIQFTKWVKDRRAKQIMEGVTGTQGYVDEVNKVLGVVETAITEKDKVNLTFNNVIELG